MRGSKCNEILQVLWIHETCVNRAATIEKEPVQSRIGSIII